MKTNHRTTGRRHLAALLSFAVLLVGLFPAGGADAMKGAERLQHLTRITKQSEAEALKPGDTIAMACAKCQSVVVMQVTQEAKHVTKMIPGQKHLCPGCSSTIEVKGAGKGAKQTIKHVCGKCGSGSAYCCATKPGSGPTSGMTH